MDNSPIRIRLASAADLQNVQLCAQAAYAKYIERMGQVPAPMVADFERQIKQSQVHIAIYSSSFAGYVVFYPKHDHMHLENVAVLPSYSGQGVGKKLVAHVERAASENGFAAVELYTNEAMTENFPLYLNLGYVETERKLQAGFNRVFFRKSI